MLLTQFPDINQVRRLRNESTKPNEQWNNVALNFECKYTSRTGVESPYSLFLNVRGHSHCSINGSPYRIEDDAFLLTRPGDIYDLTVDNARGTEICNIHINRNFFHTVAASFMAPTQALLSDPLLEVDAMPLLNARLHPKSACFNAITSRLRSGEPGDHIAFEQSLILLIEWLLHNNEKTKQQIAALPPVKAAVKADVHRRLAMACDYMRSSYYLPVDLDTLCAITCISKFHFLRLFRACYGLTPYQYLTSIRLEKGASLLKNTILPIQDISDSLGFELPNSFIKAFHKFYGCSPGQFRKR